MEVNEEYPFCGTFEGLPVLANKQLRRNQIIRAPNIMFGHNDSTNSHTIVMNPYTIGTLILSIKGNEYSDVFKKLGVTDDAVDACIYDAMERILSSL